MRNKLIFIRKFLSVLLLLSSIGFSVNARTYYVSNSGNDNNDGLTTLTPWKNLSKVSSFTGLVAGDEVLFNRGDVFYGQLIINNSGTSANPITIGAYGTGSRPVITGFTTVSNWTNSGGNIWESTNAVSALASCNMVTINGVSTAMGRYPNTGYLTYQSFTGTSITSSSLNSLVTNWTGAVAAIRKNNWIIDRDTITAHSGTVLTHTVHSSYNGLPNYGFFIQNDIRTLDTLNEWYYNSATKKISIYSTTSPANVQVSTIDSLVKMNGKNNITFNNISFIGSNTATFSINFSHHPKILDCYIDFAGINAIITRGGSCDSAKIINCFINHTNNNAIDLGGASPNCLISYDTIKNTGMFAGMGTSADKTYSALQTNSDNGIVENCFIDSTGYIGVFFYGNSTIVRNNLISNFCLTKFDGGALYTYISVTGTPFVGEQLLNNTIIGGNTSTAGTTQSVPLIHGIYLDEGAANIEISGNTAANCLYSGLYIHNAHDINIHNNTCYNNGLYQTLFGSFVTGGPIRNVTMKNNIFVSKASTQFVASFQSAGNDISSFGTIDSNYYARPIDDNVDFYITVNNNTVFLHYTLAQWQGYAGFDAHSHKSPKTITTVNDLRLDYNTTGVVKTISLDANYIDVKNVSYNGGINLAPYTSAVLIKNGSVTNQSPTANAGNDQTIQLPVSTVSLSGSGTDTDGGISAYSWTKISGSSGCTITDPASASTSVTGLVQGVYSFQLAVTDNDGATDSDTVQITVNAANILPTASAGSDQSITLPTNTVSLTGSGTDTDGGISAYSWTKISGPSGCTITDPASASTSVTGLVQGVYSFKLTVTDNDGATDSDTVQVAVNAANIPPTASAGNNQSITLPINTVSLNGSGTDSDGGISAYSWTKISGPSGCTITDPASASTSVTGLVQGVYSFKLTVTDNDGATDSDTVQVTVNAANIPPTASAGNNQSITLPINTVSLNGSGTDTDGGISAYSWTKISGPSGCTITDPASASTSVSGLVQSVYSFKLTVSDNDGATDSDTVQVTVNAANILPTASAGSDQSITLPINTVSLNGSGTDTDGGISAYSWTKISGPSGCTITDPASASTSVSGLVQGVYSFQLAVTDNDGATDSDTVQVTVNAANILPTASAGNNQSITLPTNAVSLNGSGTDTDGGISAYSWTKISGPSGCTITDPASASTSVTGLVQGVYSFKLTVTDNDGATDSDTVQVAVNAANILPTASAGNNQSITLPTNAVSLNGSGTDTDGGISAYSWTKISGPSGCTITDPASASTSVTGLVQGVYSFKLTVTDNDGATDSDTVQVAVNAANIPPTASAGNNQSITLPINTVSLNGSGTDSDGSIFSYSWTKISGPASGTITSATSASTSVTGLVQGVYSFQLTATDNDGATDSDTVQITVNAANIPPTCNAGSDQSITLPINTVTLNGSGTDSDGSIFSYSWTKISGPASGTITSATSASTSVTGLVQGVYSFKLAVTDNDGATDSDTVQITVNAANIPPTCNAGSDQSITLPINTVTLNGSGTDSDGSIFSYSWTKISGPASGTITSATSASTSVTGLVQGVYSFQLTVTDNDDATDSDTVQITVNAANIPPTSNAGIDQSITLPTSTVSLAGSGTDSDGTIAAYNWTKISGPASGTITNATSASTTATGLIQGVYKFELKVTDNNGAAGLDTVQIIVNAANIPPTSNAGIDQTITLPTNSVSLAGSGTDTDGTIAAYNWTKISGPVSGTITNATSASTTATGLVQGVYKFELKVTDNNGAAGLDTVQITVNAANIPPTSNAGIDQTITLPTSTVSLAGSGTDTDGTIAAYNWTKISGPASGTITNATSASTSVTGLVQGVYKFELKVTDNNGAAGLDTVQITVNAANIPPTSNAGPDQIITLPTSTVSLAGSGTDTDGTIAAYNWTKISGPVSGTITNATSASTTVTGLVQGVYKFELKVTDNNGAAGLDTVQITVNAANIPPTSNAGIDQTITLPTSTVSLAGSGTDTDGTIAAYNWTKISGPASGTITNATSASTSVTGLVQGVYKFELKVTDNNGAAGLDTVQVTVNIRPTANAGPDQTITLPTSTVSLAGSGTDTDGTIAAYNWTKISGPASGTITNANSASTTVTGLVQGVYKFELKVTDNNGVAGLDTVQITVNAANIPPTSNAGPDQTITLPTSTVSLAGSGTDTDGTIAAYNWTKVSGPASGTITNANSASTTVTGLVQGVYKFQLKVTDNKSATGLDTVQVTVNIRPTANAGPDQTITLPTSTVSLAGSGTDTDGTIAAYSWTKISGPASGTITNANSASTTVTGLVQGVYKFQLKVTDNRSATGLDTVQVTVNAANLPPTANAGPDQSTTKKTVTLSGNGTDPDGTISTYQWTKISGVGSTITSPNSKSTSVTGLSQGIYKFQLTVTDNKGAIGRDTMQVAVSQSALRINLLTFKGQSADGKVSLLWKAAKENNTSGFDIEKMRANTWEKMGYIQSAGGSLADNGYFFSDYMPVTGTNYYRLKIVDVEGTFVYSDILNVILKTKKNVVCQNVPNPFNYITTIRYEVTDKALVKIVVYNMAGTGIAVLANEIKQPGSYQVQWNAENIPSGNYYYTVIIGDWVRTMKMLKIN